MDGALEAGVEELLGEGDFVFEAEPGVLVHGLCGKVSGEGK